MNYTPNWWLETWAIVKQSNNNKDHQMSESKNQKPLTSEQVAELFHAEADRIDDETGECRLMGVVKTIYDLAIDGDVWACMFIAYYEGYETKSNKKFSRTVAEPLRAEA